MQNEDEAKNKTPDSDSRYRKALRAARARLDLIPIAWRIVSAALVGVIIVGVVATSCHT